MAGGSLTAYTCGCCGVLTVEPGTHRNYHKDIKCCYGVMDFTEVDLGATP